MGPDDPLAEEALVEGPSLLEGEDEAPAARSARARATASFALRILAEEPIADVFIPLSSLGTCESSPSLRYLNELKFLDSRFCGSCKVIISLRVNSSSDIRSLHIFALMFNLSIVS